MFHKIDPELQDALTVSAPQFEQQLQWLQDHNYQTITLEHFATSLHQRKSLPDRSVLITFDDAYLNNLTHALPILQRFGMSAVLFVPTAFVGRCNEWDGCTDPLMSIDQLRQLLPTFELALHSHRHLNYKHQTAAVIQADLTENIAAFDALHLPYTRAFAYPYGGRPKDAATKQAMQQAMEQLRIEMAFRIGNRLNRLPTSNRFELQRLDIRGTDSMAQFARKVRFGKLL
ncbi:polysaccharide deacetylase family protein [Larkinella insperata]|uniref:Polysaccharide deacetylase family protein n=1 Tax=Larkinella insperata TaxID=332158 RepID=A0ABW3QB32_9BACT|nr:polysaccharide deacetylase family protein [Larkinella insperata]